MSAEISLRHAGLRFDSSRSTGLKESLVETIVTWERWNKSGKTLSGAQIKELYKYLETGTAVHREGKKMAPRHRMILKSTLSNSVWRALGYWYADRGTIVFLKYLTKKDST